MASFRFCETFLLHIKPFVVNKSAVFPFLGGSMNRATQIDESCLKDQRVMSHRSTSHVTQESRRNVAEGGIQGYIVEHKMMST